MYLTPFHFLPAQRCAIAVYAMVLCLSGRLSIKSRRSIKTTKRIEMVFGVETTLGLPYVVFTREFWYLQNGHFPLELCPNFEIGRFFCYISQWHVIRRKCCQLSSTDDRCQFIAITLSVHRGLQHDKRDAARRTSSCATNETC